MVRHCVIFCFLIKSLLSLSLSLSLSPSLSLSLSLWHKHTTTRKQVKNKEESVGKAQDIYKRLQMRYNVVYDTRGAIGLSLTLSLSLSLPPSLPLSLSLSLSLSACNPK